MYYRKAFAMILTLCFFFSFTQPVSADTGPKPSLTIIVYNAPEETYYLDLLVPDKDRGDHKRIQDEPDEGKLTLLREYDQDEWRPILALGSSVPIIGNLAGRKRDDGSMIHKFDYFGIPDTFKIIIVTPENELRISQTLGRSAFDTVYYYDYLNEGVEVSGAGSANVNNAKPGGPRQTVIEVQEESILCSLIRQMVSLPVTLVIEGVILLLFGFSLKKNWKSFLLVNVATQLLMTAITGLFMYKWGLAAAFTVLLFVEGAILLGESAAYARLLKEHTVKRRVLYGATANLVSAGAIYLILYCIC